MVWCVNITLFSIVPVCCVHDYIVQDDGLFVQVYSCVVLSRCRVCIVVECNWGMLIRAVGGAKPVH